jgi:hypothetical protein
MQKAFPAANVSQTVPSGLGHHRQLCSERGERRSGSCGRCHMQQTLLHLRVYTDAS